MPRYVILFNDDHVLMGGSPCELRAHSPTFPSLHLRHNSFSNPYVALPTSQLILQPFRCFTYVTVHSPTLLSLLLRHKLSTSFTWRAAHACTTPKVRYRRSPLTDDNDLEDKQMILEGKSGLNFFSVTRNLRKKSTRNLT